MAAEQTGFDAASFRGCDAVVRLQRGRMPNLRLAIVGCGGVAAMHARHLLHLSGVEICACIDRDRARAEAFAARWAPGARIGTDYDEALALRPEVVDLCTPPHLHAPMALTALAAGCHVILEKPLAGSLAEFDQLLAAEVQTGRLVLPVLQNRLGEGPRQLRALVEAGLTGRFLHATCETVWRRGTDYYASPWRGKYATELGGPLTGLLVHQLDLVLGFAPPLAAVAAHAATLVLPIEVESTGVLLGSLADGGWLTATVTVHAQRQLSRGVLVFEHLQAEFGDHPYDYAETPWRITCSDPARQTQVDALLAALPADPTPAGLGQIWWRQARIWAALVRGETLPAARLTYARLSTARPALEALSAAYASARTGRRIPLPIGPEDEAYRRYAP